MTTTKLQSPPTKIWWSLLLHGIVAALLGPMLITMPGKAKEPDTADWPRYLAGEARQFENIRTRGTQAPEPDESARLDQHSLGSEADAPHLVRDFNRTCLLEQVTLAQSVLLDINTASVRDLGNLPGLGRTHAIAIRKARPYTGTEELVLRRIIPQRTYERIGPLITATPLSQSSLIDLNKASIRDLRDLPGIRQSLAFAIRNGRPYNSTEELALRRVIPRRAYERIRQLVTVNPL